MRQLIAVTPDNANQNAVDTGSYTRWNNQAYGSVHRGTDPYGTDSNQEEIMDSNINLTWCDSMGGNSSTVNLGSLYNRIDIIFTRPEMTKITRGKDDN
ncbi:hypothetical protein TNCV_1291151 [Trichonephila clavipes]|nr:hypothetical protein TNCV_1680221 [Trichonephila clavipes]GFX66434.1 hypothetical protein TNCV_1291151 [Trichonephila clavipes]